MTLSDCIDGSLTILSAAEGENKETRERKSYRGDDETSVESPADWRTAKLMDELMTVMTRRSRILSLVSGKADEDNMV